MKPFLSLYFLMIFIWECASAQEIQEKTSFNNQIKEKQILGNNHIEQTKEGTNNTIDLIKSHKDSLYQSLNQHLGKTDSLNDFSSTIGDSIDSLSSNELISDSIQLILTDVSDSIKALQKNLIDNTPEELNEQVAPTYLSHPIKKVENDFPEINIKGITPNNTNLDKDIIPDMDQTIDRNISIPDLPEVEDLNQENIDQLIDNKSTNIDELIELQRNSGQSSMGPIDEAKGINDKISQYGNPDEANSMGKSFANEQANSKMNELFQEHGEKLEKAKDILSELKKKYSAVPNSNDLSTATKINSLKDAPMKKRLMVGGNFNFERGNPLTLDLSPLMMYKINKVFYAGISASYRLSLKHESKTTTTHAEDVVGGSVILRHKVIKGFFGYSEFEYKSSPIQYDNQINLETATRREWVPGMLLGIGKELSLKGKLNGTVILTYDLLHSENSFQKSPWDVKFGINLEDLDLKNRRKELKENFLKSIR